MRCALWTCGSGQLADDGWCHGRKRPLPWPNRIRRSLNQTEAIGYAHLAGEVIHFVIEQKAEALNGHAIPEPEVQRVGAGNRVALRIDDGEVRGLRRFVTIRFDL